MTREEIIKKMLELEPIKENKEYTQYLLNELRLIRWKQEYQRNKPDPLRNQLYSIILHADDYVTFDELKEKTGASSAQISSRMTRLIKDERVERQYYRENGVKKVSYKHI